MSIAQPLRVTVNASVLSHDVLDGFDSGGVEGHRSFQFSVFSRELWQRSRH